MDNSRVKYYEGRTDQWFKNFGSSKFVQGTRDFLNSNSLIAKTAFLILTIIVFIICLRLGIAILGWLFEPSEDPVLIDCMHKATISKVINTDPNAGAVKPILRSKNQYDGLDFTWSTWVYVDEHDSVDAFRQLKSSHNSNSYILKHIFSKGEWSQISGGAGALAEGQASESKQFSGAMDGGGSENMGAEKSRDGTGLLMPNNSPGLYLQYIKGGSAHFETNQHTANGTTPGSMVNLFVVLNTIGGSSGIYESITIEDMPLNKWVNVVIRVTKQKQVDVYINGSLSKRLILSNVVRQNYGNVYVCQNGGFEGFISSFRYFNYGLGTNKIMSIAQGGPSLNRCTKSSVDSNLPPYLSSRWYFSSADDMYNP